MKPRFAIYALLLALATLALVFWRRPVQRPTSPDPTPTVQATDDVPATLPPAVSTASQTSSNPSPAPVSPPAMRTQADEEPWRREEYQRAADEANVPIDFHGRVIDQDSNALSGVTVKIFIQHWAMTDSAVPPPGWKEPNLKRITGADGRFELTGETGSSIAVEAVEKAGYELEPNTLRNYGPSSGSFANPVSFKMWNTSIHEQLIAGHKSFDIVPDGRPYLIDLAKGTIAESGTGDLRVWIKYQSQVVRGKTYDWSCQIDVLNGGLLEQRDISDSMFLAPVEGYTPSFQLEQQIKGGQRGSIGGQRRFYLRLNNGQECGRMDIGLYAPFNNETPGLVSLSYVINPSGSRILR